MEQPQGSLSDKAKAEKKNSRTKQTSPNKMWYMENAADGMMKNSTVQHEEKHIKNGAN